ncbi:MAG: hypothetical protein ABI852_06630 [Gemmatimonadaceae bacterium]
MRAAVAYVPILTTLVGAVFAAELWRHWRRKPSATYLMWWFLGILTYVAGTITESLTALFGWHSGVFRAWYITGALLGAAPLAQGSVYLLLPKRVANTLAVLFVATVLFASTFVILSPLDLTHPSIMEGRLTGKVLEWTWVRRFSPFLNSYGAVFLIGGAVWSALKYRKVPDAEARVRGNWLIAIGTLLPGIGGTATRYGYTEVLFVTELIGLLLVWRGYRTIVRGTGPSIHLAQQPVTT